MNWHSILDSKENIFQNKLLQISNILKKELKSDTINLMGGKAGVALFFFYYSKLTKEEKYTDIGFELLSNVFDEINKGFNYHVFSGGLAGIGWTIECLIQNGFLDADTSEVLDDLDDYLFKAMMADIKKGNYDYLHGAVGNGLE